MIKLFSTKSCAYCGMVRKLLDSKKQDYEYIDIDEVPGAREEAYRISGALTVPIIQVDNDVVVGWNPAQLIPLL